MTCWPEDAFGGACPVRNVIGGGSVQQLNLRYINTNFATLAGADALAEYDVSDSLTAFATLAYVEGTNHRANGSREPLPMIPPLKSRLGGFVFAEAETA